MWKCNIPDKASPQPVKTPSSTCCVFCLQTHQIEASLCEMDLACRRKLTKKIKSKYC